jgi:hypothetical protein
MSVKHECNDKLSRNQLPLGIGFWQDIS